MFKYLLAGILCVLSACSVFRAAPTPKPLNFTEDRLASLRARAVLIEVDCEDDDDDTGGTGAIIDRHRVLTALHVLDNIDGCLVTGELESGEVVELDLIKISKKYDLALAITENDLGLSTPFAKSVSLGEPVTCIGYPVDLMEDSRERKLNVAMGFISSDNIETDGVEYLRVSSPIYFGHSGSACYNTRGEIVGVADLLASAPLLFPPVPYDGAYYLVRFDHVREFLKIDPPARPKADPPVKVN